MINTEAAIPNVILSEPLVNLMKANEVSLRLNKLVESLGSNKLRVITIRDYIAALEAGKIDKLYLRNIGTRTKNELMSLVMRYINSPRINNSRIDEQPARNDFPNNNSVLPSPPSKDLHIIDIVHHFIGTLRNHERTIICSRYGIENESIKTLEQLGVMFNITRERVRQIESKIKNDFFKLYKNSLIECTRKDRDIIFLALSKGDRLLRKRNLKVAIRHLRGEYLFAIECSYFDGLKEYLVENYQSADTYWCLDEIDKSSLRNIAKLIKLKIKTLEVPITLNTLARICEIDTALLRYGLESIQGFSLYRNYVCKGRVGTRLKRTIDLHLVLEKAKTGYMGLGCLIQEHSKTHDGYSCSERDAIISMELYDHMFSKLGEKGWGYIGNFDSEDPCITGILNTPFSSSVYGTDIDSAATGKSLRNTIAEILKEKGPLHFQHLRHELRRRVGNTYSPASVGPILQAGGFVRLAPGIYGIPVHLFDLVRLIANSKEMLTYSDCYLYVLARHAGEDYGSYPLWSPMMEYRYCTWLERYVVDLADSVIVQKLFRSLMSVCEPNRWPANNDEINRWLKLKGDKSRYEFYSIMKPRKMDYIPSIREVFAVCIYANAEGKINWMMVNRISGWPLSDKVRSVALLALLIALGLLHPQNHWQNSHQVTERIKNAISVLRKNMYINKDLSWSVRPIAEIIKPLASERLGWVSHDYAQNMLGRLTGVCDIPVPEVYQAISEDDSTLDDFLDEFRSDLRKTKHKDLLQSLVSGSLS